MSQPSLAKNTATNNSTHSSNQNTLCLTNSNTSSISSYSSSSNNESPLTRVSSIGGKVRQAISRKRSQSLNHVERVFLTSDSTSNRSLHSKAKFSRNKSISSIFPSAYTSIPSLSTSPLAGSTRDNSISSMSDIDLDFTALQHHTLSKIDESKMGMEYPKNTLPLHLQRRQSLKQPLKESDIKIYDEMADDILNKVAQDENSIDWRI